VAVKAVYYVAHPVSGDAVGNAHNAIAWVKWLTLNDPSRVYIAPWVAEVLAFADDIIEPEFYDRVLADDQDVVRHLDGVILVGGTVSKGMLLECDAAIEKGLRIIDWHQFRAPADVPAGLVPDDPPSVVRARTKLPAVPRLQ
jgi:hypothetical protein